MFQIEGIFINLMNRLSCSTGGPSQVGPKQLHWMTFWRLCDFLRIINTMIHMEDFERLNTFFPPDRFCIGHER